MPNNKFLCIRDPLFLLGGGGEEGGGEGRGGAKGGCFTKGH